MQGWKYINHVIRLKGVEKGWLFEKEKEEENWRNQNRWKTRKEENGGMETGERLLCSSGLNFREVTSSWYRSSALQSCWLCSSEAHTYRHMYLPSIDRWPIASEPGPITSRFSDVASVRLTGRSASAHAYSHQRATNWAAAFSLESSLFSGFLFLCEKRSSHPTVNSDDRFGLHVMMVPAGL